jgi:UDPglucose--hexose-1-phosphate uridylyltransferase
VPEVRIDPLTGLRAIIAADADDGVALAADAPPVAPEANRDLFWAGPASGDQERIPHAPPAEVTLAELALEQVLAAVARWRERMRAHEGSAYVHVSAEQGADYAQLYAFDFVPTVVARERERFGAYATRTMGANLQGDLVQEEVRRRERVVAIDAESVLMAPFGSRAPYQLMIAPRRPRARFEADGPTGAAMLHDALARLRARFGAPPPLGVWVRTAPRGADHFCWRIDILPQLAGAGGLELGVGLPLNRVPPERAAAELRDPA